MNASEYVEMDALALANAVRARTASAKEVLAAALERAAAVNDKINALTALFSENAYKSIEAGLPDGPLGGVPFLLKDLSISLAGTVTSAGSALFGDVIADHDSTIVERYKRAGLVIFGKTATPEFGLAPSTETTRFGTVRNPYDLDRTSGGSSGGAAAAVAARIVPAAHASDGGGSIRIPAAACGLFGLKPTRARTPAGPDVGEGWAGLSSMHVVSRSVRDSAALLDATHMPSLGDPYFAPPVKRPFLDEVGTEPGVLRIAFSTRPPIEAPIDPACIRAIEQAAELLTDLGHKVEEDAPKFDGTALGMAWFTIVSVNVVHALRERERTLGRAIASEEIEAVTQRTADFGRRLKPEDYVAAIAEMHRHGRRVAAFHQRFDILMTPTLAAPPVALGTLRMDNRDGEQYRKAAAGFAPFTVPQNMSGQPSMSVPLYWTDDGLPVGVMFSAAFGAEATLFQLAGQLERARPWADRRPVL